MTPSLPPFDLVGIGIGPSNLSLAALLEPHQLLRSCFFDAKKEFQWHPGMLFPEATIQVSHLKDLVTLVDPTNPLSFLAFLAANKRLYRFAAARFPKIKRKEFNQYFQWVCGKLDNLQFGTKVLNIDFVGDHFSVEHTNGCFFAKKIVLGTGLSPKIPQFIRPFCGETIFHASRYLHQQIDPTGKKIAVIGGGQSGAEVIKSLLNGKSQLPQAIAWITRRSNFLPIDDSPFTNEYFFPPYSEYFFGLPESTKPHLIREQNLASDGINPDLLAEIYQELYELELVEAKGKFCTLLKSHEFIDLSKNTNGWSLVCNNVETGVNTLINADLIVLATGFEYRPPSFLKPLMHLIKTQNKRFVIRSDFSIDWNGPPENKIFIQNGAQHVRGVADPNLSLMSYRSACIINSILGYTLYDLGCESTALDWPDSAQSPDYLPQNGKSKHINNYPTSRKT